MTSEFTPEEHRAKRIVESTINDFSIDLSGLKIYTEAATGPYLYSPIIAASAGADHVYAVTEDSRFGKKEEVKNQTDRVAKKWGLEDRITVTFEKNEKQVSTADVITNSGFVRPISQEMVSWAKETAVVPLTYEPWELREDDIDIDACIDENILVMGLNEGAEPLSIYPYGGFLGVKLLFDMGIEGYKNSILLIGGGIGFGRSIYETYRELDIDTEWFANNETEARPYAELRSHLLDNAAEYDAIVVAEHEATTEFLGDGGIVTAAELKELNPAIRIGVIAGQVDQESLDRVGLQYHPDHLREYGYQNYQPSELGMKAPLELYAAGLRVGQTLARYRLEGHTVGRTSRLADQNTLIVPLETEPFRSIE